MRQLVGEAPMPARRRKPESAERLVMPDSAFAEFCEYYQAEILPDEKTGEVISLQDIKDRTAGLLQTPTA